MQPDALTSRPVLVSIADLPQHMVSALAQLVRFAWTQAQACAFAGALFAGMAVSAQFPLPLARYDALLLYAIVVTAIFWLTKIETSREIIATALFHLVGLIFELVKVRLGSWSYPDDALSKVWGVPLYSGFMYAAVGSYIARAWRLFDLRLLNYRPIPTACVAALIYVNFFTHHLISDLRMVLALALLWVMRGTWVYFTVGAHRHRMPLSAAMTLIGAFLWLAENLSTLLRAWQYPHQSQGWALVHVNKLGSWALLVVVSFVLVAAWKHKTHRTQSPYPAVAA